ncbi:hypothetical protein O0I10_000977 [Lichtheimia ornata]|uniref:Cellulase n=1 Tax=Lichtheimia ornata TaxID=688661 RepID=A0AAD7Y4N0_9FUNG|nr:uncharacterized protein O0I10_000977 [Lichtheimia ornata]KAJ8663728.1 hypothetical protein O0I10_000977 [Lichtheimia ornata]
MRTSFIGFLVVFAGAHQLISAADCENPPYGRCGGKGFEGNECCTEGYECTVQNDYYSQCVPVDNAKSDCSKAYEQCGGKSFTGSKCCVDGFKCVKANAWYSQCLPKYQWGSSSAAAASSDAGHENSNNAESTTEAKPTATSTSSASEKQPQPTTTVSTTEDDTKPTTTTTVESNNKETATTTTTTSASSPSSSSSSSNYKAISGGASGEGHTTRYWDCCKASCSWPDKADVDSPVKTCAADGIKLVDANEQSGCNGGSGYMCNDNQPWAVNDDLAYGFAATALSGKGESETCCSCYELTFTSGEVKGKRMVVQSTNTGGDLSGNQFDLQIPGGGVGIFNGCQSQWNAPANGWGERYGGISSASQCDDLPKHLQAGCEWRFNWFKNADNPSVTFKEVTCPAEIVKKSGCSRN